MNEIFQALNKHAAAVDAVVEAHCQGMDPTLSRLTDAIRYSFQSGGKRIRPALTLEFCALFGGNLEAALPMAAAVEMIHTYSLIHDDLPCMDDDDFRRGRPSLHSAFDEATAVLAGDALLTHAFLMLSNNPAVSPAVSLEAVRALAHGAGIEGMIGGQQLDMDGKTLSCELHEKMNRLKTGALIRTACQLGCLAAEATPKQTEAALLYADRIGLAFQIIDDLLDEAEAEDDDKTTFLSFYTPDEARAYAERLTDEAIQALAPYKGSELLCSLARLLCSRTQ